MQIEIRGAEKLSFREKQVVALKEMGRSNEEIAEQLGIGVSTVATLYHRARRKGFETVIIFTGDPLEIFNQEESE